MRYDHRVLIKAFHCELRLGIRDEIHPYWAIVHCYICTMTYVTVVVVTSEHYVTVMFVALHLYIDISMYVLYVRSHGKCVGLSSFSDDSWEIAVSNRCRTTLQTQIYDTTVAHPIHVCPIRYV